MRKQKLPLDEIISAGGSLISDKPPKTLVGRILRVLKRLITFKDTVNIRINKRP